MGTTSIPAPAQRAGVIALTTWRGYAPAFCRTISTQGAQRLARLLRPEPDR